MLYRCNSPGFNPSILRHSWCEWRQMKECCILCKKRLSIFPSPGSRVGGGGCHGPNSPWPGILKFFPARESLDPDPGSGSAIRKNAGSGSVSGSTLNQCGSATLPQTISKFYKRRIFWNKSFPVHYSTLPPCRFHCVGGLWDRTLDCWLRVWIDGQTL